MFDKVNRCISEELTEVAAWYRGTIGPKFNDIREISVYWPDPNHAKFRHPLTRSVRDIRCGKFVLLKKWTKIP